MVNYNVNVGGGFNAGKALQGLGQQWRENQAQEEAKAQREQMQGLLLKARQGDADAMDQVIALNPDIGIEYENHQQKMTKEKGLARAEISNKKTNDWSMQWQNATTEQKEQMKQAAYDDDDIDFGDDERSLSNEQFDFITKLHLRQNFGDKALSPPSSDKGLPAEAVAFNDLIKDMTPEQQKKAKMVKAGLKGRAMSNALITSIENGTVNNLKEAKAQIKQAEKFASATGASRAKMIDKGFEKIKNIDKSIGNIDRAIKVVQDGAGVGAVERLWPSIKAATVELDNIRGDMALDVVGATTFGALSKGELDLAKDIALPTGLDSKELADYLQRKKAAQQKLRNYYNEQIQFLDQGGTVAGFLRSKERGSSNNSQQQGQNSTTLSDEDLVKKYGG